MVDQLVLLDDEHLLFLTGMAVLACVATTILTAIIAVQVRKLRERQLELGFKSDLLYRGLSVDDAVRLMTCRRPTWAQSIMSLGDWTLLKLSRGWQNVTGALPGLFRPCRRVLQVAWQKSERFFRGLSHEAPIWFRSTWRRGEGLCRSLWREARPLLRRTIKSASDCVHWLGNQTDRLVRRLAPHRP